MDEGGSVDEVSLSLSGSLSLSLSLSEEAPWRGPGGSSFTGDPGKYVKKVSECEHLSMGALLWPRGTRYVGEGALIDE
jgi:hypothetical protein